MPRVGLLWANTGRFRGRVAALESWRRGSRKSHFRGIPPVTDPPRWGCITPRGLRLRSRKRAAEWRDRKVTIRPFFGSIAFAHFIANVLSIALPAVCARPKRKPASTAARATDDEGDDLLNIQRLSRCSVPIGTALGRTSRPGNALNFHNRGGAKALSAAAQTGTLGPLSAFT